MMCFLQHFICNVWILCLIMFFLLFHFLLFVMFVMFGYYIKEKKKKMRKCGRGVNCEEEIREKNEMGEGGCMCVVGEKKKERKK
jgi:predicted membrane protein